MGYVNSYYWKLRQKIGKQRLVTATVDVLPVRSDGKIKLVFEKWPNHWSTVGGHAELGESWNSAAINELKEEAGIVAHKDDLELFATISGAGRIYQYPDGSTQAFSNCYVVKKWSFEDKLTDEEEIGQTKWFSINEVKELDNLDSSARLIIEAYEEFLKTSKVQMIEEKELR